MTSTTDLLLNLLGGAVRPRGITVAHRSEPPAKLLKLYDIEASPFCRLVREVLTELDLDAMILPCPVGGRRFRLEAEKLGGRQQFPLLVDENNGTVMYESADIIDYLRATYGQRNAARRGWRRKMAVATSGISSVTMLRARGMTGRRAQASRRPEKPLELYSFEFSPYSKPVRAELCELELPYILRNTGKGHWKEIGTAAVRDKLWKAPMGTTRNRRWLEENTGRVQVPYLIDANTGTSMYESARILQYLHSTYAI